MKLSKTFALAGFLAGSLILPGPMATAEAHDKDNGHGLGKSKHYSCYDKHGRWRSHPHCPPPQHSYHHGYHHDHDRYPSHTRYYRSAPAPYQRHPEIIYVRKDGPYDRRVRRNNPVVQSRATIVSDSRTRVQQSRDQLRADQMELKNDRAELRRDIRNKVGKDEITRDRQEIRADLDKIKSTRSDLRKDQSQLAGARR
jgi:hypothetical protein